MQQPKLFQSDAHRDRRDEEDLSEGLGNAIKRLVVILGAVEIADSKVEPRKLDIGMADRRSRLEDSRLASGNAHQIAQFLRQISGMLR